MGTKKEIEIKIKIRNSSLVRKKVLSLGAKPLGRKRQLDIYYDSTKKEVIDNDEVRKLRLEGRKAIFTFKQARDQRSIAEHIHKRIELETEIKDIELARAILKGWGHTETEIAEKIRETFEYKGLEILIDNVAFLGWWVEIEGEEREILAAIQKLGLDISKAEKRHYGEIYADFCRRTGCSYTNEMTFEKEKEWIERKK